MKKIILDYEVTFQDATGKDILFKKGMWFDVKVLRGGAHGWGYVSDVVRRKDGMLLFKIAIEYVSEFDNVTRRTLDTRKHFIKEFKMFQSVRFLDKYPFDEQGACKCLSRESLSKSLENCEISNIKYEWDN